MIRPGSQNARILAVLWDGREHTVTEIHRRAGTCRLNSRISELRKRYGCTIECTRKARRRGASSYAYRLLATPPDLQPPPEQELWARLQAEAQERRKAVPRDDRHRYRIYAIRDGDVLDIVGAAGTAAGVGEEIVRLGRDGKLHGVCIGLLDSLGTDAHDGTWIVNPWDQ